MSKPTSLATRSDSAIDGAYGPLLIGMLAIATVILLASTRPDSAGIFGRRDIAIALGTVAVVVVMVVTLRRGLVAGAGCAFAALLATAAFQSIGSPADTAPHDISAVVWGLLVATLGLALRADLAARKRVRRTLERAEHRPSARPAAASHTLDGELAQLDRAVRDLSSEHRRLQKILDSQPGCTLVLDTDGRVAVAGGQVLKLLGRWPVRGQTLAEALAGAGLRLGQKIDALLDDGIEVEHRGRHLWLRRADVCHDGVAATVSVLDVSALRRAVDERAATLRFISHDIRSPQSSIVALTDLHDTDPVAFAQCGGMPQIARLAHHTLALSEWHLRASPDSGAMERQFIAFDLRRVAAEAAQHARPRALMQGVGIDSSGCTGRPLVIPGLPDLVARVLQNLLDNAVRASHAGCTVWVGAEQQHGLVRLRVRDEAGGLPGVVGRCFITDPVNRPVPGIAQGFGLGLKITAQVVAMHYGSIVFDSEQGRGTEVTISFPARRSDAAGGSLE